MDSVSNMHAALAVGVAYLVGSLSFAVLVSRLMGLADPRTYGSGNPGATNVLRSGNRAAAVLTLALDALKGYLPVLVALLLAPRFSLSALAVALVGLAAFVGHLWPVFFGFKGGKGVATAAGVLLALNPVLGAATLGSWVLMAVFFGFKGGKGVATAAGVLLALNPVLGAATLGSWVLMAVFFRYSSLAAIVAAVFAPFFQLLVWGAQPVLAAVVPMSLLLLWRHGPNIRKLLAGTESRIGQGGKPGPAQRG